MKKLIFLLAALPLLAHALELSRFDGTYKLLSNRGDDHQFVPPCPDSIDVKHDKSRNMIESNYFKFEKINQGSYQEYGEAGTRETFTRNNSVVREYKARKLFQSYWKENSITLEDGGRTLAVRVRDDEDIDLECLYGRTR